MGCHGFHLPTLDGFEAARAFFGRFYAVANLRRESLWIAHVDDQAQCLHLANYQGEESMIDFPFRQIIIDVAEYCSTGIFLAHNHLSGDARPSNADYLATRKLARAAEALNCSVLDHLIFTKGECTSFRRMGLL